MIKSFLVLQWSMGLAMEAKQQCKKHNIEKTREMLSQGKSLDEIAKQLNVKTGTVKNYVKEIRKSVAEAQKEIEEQEKQPSVSFGELIKNLVTLPVNCLVLLFLSFLLVVVKVLKLTGLRKYGEEYHDNIQ